MIIIMSIYIGKDLEHSLKILEMEKASSEKCNKYHQVVHEIDYMSNLHVDSSFRKQSMKIVNYLKIKEWVDSSIGQSTVIQELEEKGPKLSNLTKHKIEVDMLISKIVLIYWYAIKKGCSTQPIISLLMSSIAWVKRCYSEKSKNVNKLLVFEALYP